MRRYDLEGQQHNREALLARLAEIELRDPSREHLYALAELAYVDAKRAERTRDAGGALELYGASVLYAYQYLFTDKYADASNPYDPQFRRGCDLYNAALESTLRLIQHEGDLGPGKRQLIRTPNHDCHLEVVLKSDGWHADDFDHVEFVSDYEVHGLRNHYHNFGLGVPLVAVRRHHEDEDPREQYYPPDLSFPVTAFLRIENGDQNLLRATYETASVDGSRGKRDSLPSRENLRAVLELRDPLEDTTVEVAGQRIPLETDLSTPLAHFLSQPALDDTRVSTLGLLKPEKVKQLTGLYMLEPFRADKIPVLMVHGLWSSP
ncbi:MAG: hypothetical protein AAF961_15055, partial [Planctomycetota bacterium]